MKLAPEVIQVLANSTVSGTTLHLPNQLDRPLYVKVAKALELLGGKWNRKAGAHVFDEPAELVVADAVATGQVIDWKQEYQFFPTPPAVVQMLLDRADIEPDQTILEPSAGSGAILDGLAQMVATYPVDVFELNDRLRAGLELRPNVRVLGADFMAATPEPVYDRIIANPPFSRSQDIKHVERMFEWLKPGGKITTVMGAGYTFREDRLARDFRSFLGDAAWSEALPPKAFASSGTNVNTRIVCIEKS